MSRRRLRAATVVVPVAALALAVQAATGLAGGAELRRNTGFTVTAPGDGARVGDEFLLSWRPGGHSGRFAVVVDETVPEPGAAVPAGDRTIVTEATALTMRLGTRDGGSPSARHWHRIMIVALDDGGRRIGERVASVQVRTRG